MRLWALIFAALALLAMPFALGLGHGLASGAAMAVAALFLALSAATFFVAAGKEWKDWRDQNR